MVATPPLPAIDTCAATPALYHALHVPPTTALHLVAYQARPALQLVTLLASGDDYAALVLLTFRAQRPVAALTLSGGVCSGYEEDATGYQFCRRSSTCWLTDSTLAKTSVDIHSRDIPTGPHTIDSVRTIYRLLPAGQFSLVRRDSIRRISTQLRYP